jgi:phosphoribosylformimino-5-aminoimidazole carboxamide ribotide isomerase
VRKVLQRGAARVIVGTRAVKSPDFVKELLDCFGAECIVLGIDARDGKVALEGWVETSSISALEFGHNMKSLGIKTCVFTDISRDGLLSGPNLGSTQELAQETGLNTIASGGCFQCAKHQRSEGFGTLWGGRGYYRQSFI